MSYQTIEPPWPVFRQMEIAVVLSRVAGPEAQWTGRIVRIWSLDVYPVVDDRLGDELADKILEQVAQRWAQVQVSAAARGPAPQPGAQTPPRQALRSLTR